MNIQKELTAFKKQGKKIMDTMPRLIGNWPKVHTNEAWHLLYTSVLEKRIETVWDTIETACSIINRMDYYLNTHGIVAVVPVQELWQEVLDAALEFLWILHAYQASLPKI